MADYTKGKNDEEKLQDVITWRRECGILKQQISEPKKVTRE